MSNECKNCCCEVDEFCYYCRHTENWYCERYCVYEDLEVKEVSKAPVKTCSVCGEMLEPDIYETYAADGEYFCCTECLDEYFGIKFTTN